MDNHAQEILQLALDLEYMATEKKTGLVKGAPEYEYYQGVSDTARKVVATLLGRESIPDSLRLDNLLKEGRE